MIPSEGILNPAPLLLTDLAEELQLELLNGKAPGTQCPEWGENYKRAPMKSTTET